MTLDVRKQVLSYDLLQEYVWRHIYFGELRHFQCLKFNFVECMDSFILNI